jgi:hypothetical protein
MFNTLVLPALSLGNPDNQSDVIISTGLGGTGRGRIGGAGCRVDFTR